MDKSLEAKLGQQDMIDLQNARELVKSKQGEGIAKSGSAIAAGIPVVSVKARGLVHDICRD